MIQKNKPLFTVTELAHLSTNGFAKNKDSFTLLSEQRIFRLNFTYNYTRQITFVITIDNLKAVIDFQEETSLINETNLENVKRYITYAKKCKEIQRMLLKKKSELGIHHVLLDEHVDNYTLPKWLVYGRELPFFYINVLN